MGMYDNVRCERPLPAPGLEGVTFQTKSLDCGLDLYTIRADGSLWVRRREDVLQEVEAIVTGEIFFYDYAQPGHKQVSFSAYFLRGLLQSGPHLINDERIAQKDSAS